MNELKNVYPVRNCDQEIKNELVTVLYKKKKPTFIEKIFFKKQFEKPYKIDLDEVGSFIWHLCDGAKNIDEITILASQHFKDKIKPAEERVELFVNQMHKNKLILLFEKK